MRISQIKKENLDGTDYEFEIKGDLKLYINGYELAKDWLDDDLYNEIINTMEIAIKDSIVNNRNPYFHHKHPHSREKIMIQAVINQMGFYDMPLVKLVARAVAKTKLPEEECIKIIKEIRPDFDFDSDWRNRL